MLELYQFELSQYSEKVRLILDYKELDYRKIEVTPGVGQLELFQLSGQSKVPVLKDGDTVISDSTAIAMYLDRKYPDKPIIPSDPKERGLCLLIEEWADESIGTKSRKVVYGALSQNPDFRKSVLPNQTPDVLKTVVGSVPSEFLDILGFGVGCGTDAVKEAKDGLKQDLEALSLLLLDSPYLVSNSPCLADFAVAGLSLLLKFPDGNYLDIPQQYKGQGIPGFADSNLYETFFAWRDRIYADYRKPLVSDSPSDSQPTSIEID
ncbi:MAG: glutathione S-transferase family protein [Moorea sp. SIO3I7]|uniref:Glutathione S-transferase n=1 Tax=Moorena bouillonii PNG TaxID=568701 RepID=A0A1U7N484_9CYAN|nr:MULTISPECIES: glutathione S-transferase family protein [Moorena]NEN96963.1 glutathione S-transferase family protein [Moorena sp. SIO3I7]NEO04411.1 glutathione S-transferase family protein [Moorena sp. SIO3I8]NEP24187.1 glutathione S-transferase family protein [Moorena sp. SIO3I6]OLT60731.1 glutathione S-transferase [Moorena bouillonii PNG]